MYTLDYSKKTFLETLDKVYNNINRMNSKEIYKLMSIKKHRLLIFLYLKSLRVLLFRLKRINLKININGNSQRN